MGRMSRSEWKKIRLGYLERLRSRGAALELCDNTWAATPAGQWVSLPVADECNPGRWLAAFNHNQFEKRSALGIIILCRTDSGELLDFGLSRTQLEQIDAHLPYSTARGSRETKLNVRRVGSRHELLLKGREPFDLTHTLGSVGWIQSPPLPAVAEGVASYSAPIEKEPQRSRDGVARVHRFYARCRVGRLEPLDDSVAVEDGVYLVTARAVEHVPAVSSFRRIASLSAADDLPADLADQHTHYAHGGPLR